MGCVTITSQTSALNFQAHVLVPNTWRLWSGIAFRETATTFSNDNIFWLIGSRTMDR
jgi:hypothetical protein